MINRFTNNPKPDWKIAILCFRDYIGCEILTSTFNATPIKGYKVFYGIDSNETERQVFEADISGHKVGIITRLSWGGPQAAILVEELTHLGVQYIIGYGAAGSIDEEISKGELVVGVRSLNTDGISKMYLPDKLEFLCNNEILQITREVAKKLQFNIKEVTVANVDALYRETKDLIRKFQSEQEYRRKNIGVMLQNHAKQYLKKIGYEKLYICTEIDNYYEKNNWINVGVGYSIGDDKYKIYETSC